MSLNTSDSKNLPAVDDLIGTIKTQLESTLQASQGNAVMIGIRTGGAWIAESLHQSLGFEAPLGILDISFYRDDFSQSGLNPKVQPSSLPFDIDDKHVILVDDVIMSGRTIRAAMNEIFDYGRPQRITLASLIDLSARELPIQADIIGTTMHLENNERVKLQGPSPLSLSITTVEESLD